MSNEDHDEGDKAEAGDGDSTKERASKPRKEKVLHTRVPVVLEQELKRLATSWRVPVSNVVRTILEDAVTTIDSMGRVAEGELRGVADRLRERRNQLLKPFGEQQAASGASGASEQGPRPAAAPLAGVVGYQPLLLARDERCSLCGGPLAAGSSAFLGIRETTGGPKVILGQECLPLSAAGRPEGLPDQQDNEQKQEKSDE